ncbi:MAG: hypothetical protein WA197_21430 [Candidatus Acidiferrales bacterium]
MHLSGPRASPQPMHVDAHQHFWPYNPVEYDWIDDSMRSLRRNFLPADLQPELEHNGFQGCVAVQARQTLEETRWPLDLAQRFVPRLAPRGWAIASRIPPARTPSLR